MSEEIPTGLPASMALAWGITGPGTRGPKRALTLDRIVGAGMALAASDGLGAVSMGRVAERLGVSTMALYRYVAAKDDLVELMVDAALGRPPAAQPGEDWRAGLRRWAEGCRDAYRANPWALRVPITSPPLGPNNIRWLEDALASLRDTPLSAQDKLSSVLLLSGFVRNEELLLADMLDATVTGKTPRNYPRLLASVIDDRDFPQVSSVLAAGALDDEDGLDREFDFGLQRVLDGIAALIAAYPPRP